MTALPHSGCQEERTTPAWRDLALLALVCALVRGLVFLVQETQIVQDSPGYLRVAQLMLAGDSSWLDGYRTPGYPAFLALCGAKPLVARIVQHLLGIGSALLVFHAVFRMAGRTVALLCGLLMGCSLNYLMLESSILAETPSVFLVCMSVFLLSRVRENGRLRVLSGSRDALFLGLACGALTLIRPQYLTYGLLLPVLFAAFAGLSGFLSWGGLARFWVLSLTPQILLAGAWLATTKIALGKCILSLFAPFAMLDHTGYFAESLPPEFEPARSILIRHREENRALVDRMNGHRDFAMVGAIHEIRRVYGLTDVESYTFIGELNRAAIRSNPPAYLRSMAGASARFWRVSFEGDETFARAPQHWPRVTRLWRLNKAVWLSVNALFLFVCIPWLALRKEAPPALRALALSVLFGCLLQGAMTYASNARYAVSFEVLCLVVLAGCLGCLSPLSRWRARSRARFCG